MSWTRPPASPATSMGGGPPCILQRMGHLIFKAGLFLAPPAAIVCAWAVPARAQVPSSAEPPGSDALSSPQAARPWADGVPEAEQALASELYVAGNYEFTESHYAQALAKYK